MRGNEIGKVSYTEKDWRRTYGKPGGIGIAMSSTWLLNGCPICGCKSWQVTSDCWAYCDGCAKGIPTDYPFTESGEIISHLGLEDAGDE